jgi:hypothetical protein
MRTSTRCANTRNDHVTPGTGRPGRLAIGMADTALLLTAAACGGGSGGGTGGPTSITVGGSERDQRHARGE